MVSVVIAVRNGASTLEECLRSIYRSNYEDFEVVVVDDASSDDSAALAARFPCRVICLESPSGPARARNVGAACSLGKILFFTDSDVVILPDSLRRAVRSLQQRPEVAAVMGSYTVETSQRNFVSRYKNYLHHFTHRCSKGEVSSFFTGCGAIRRGAFQAIGGFDESIKGNGLEDVELGYRLCRSGSKVLLDDELQVVHRKHYSLRSLLRSDLLERAIPYVQLMWRHRIFKPELCTQRHHVWSVLLMAMLPFLMAAGLASGQSLAAAWAGILTAALLLYLNRRFYRFLYATAGLGFLLKGVVMHWWGYWYSGIGAAVGLAGSLSDQCRPPAKRWSGGKETRSLPVISKEEIQL